MNFRYTSVGQMKENGGLRVFRNYGSLHATSVYFLWVSVTRTVCVPITFGKVAAETDACWSLNQ